MRSMINFSDDAILKGLKEKKSDSIRFLYREYFPMAKSIVEKNSGSYEDAEDVFQVAAGGVWADGRGHDGDNVGAIKQ